MVYLLPPYNLLVWGMKVRGRTFTFIVKKAEEGGYIAKCVELPQVHTEGDTMNELKKNMRDALRLALDYIEEKVKKEEGTLVKIRIP
mgnify:CR=1 FL=1